MAKLIKIIQSRIFQWLVAFTALGILFCFVDIDGLEEAFSNFTTSKLTLFLFISVILIYISSLKWQLFIETKGERISVLKLFILYILGYFINLILPSYFGGDAVRSWYAGKDVDKHQAFAATFMERYTGVLAMLILSLIFMWNVSLVTNEIRIAMLILTVCVALGIYIGLQPRLIDFIERHIYSFKRLSPHCRKIQAALRDAHKQPILMLKALGYSLLFHIFTVINVAVAGYCIGWTNIPYQDLFVVLPIVLLIAFIPISPSGLGLQEGAYVYFLQGLGATSDQALAMALALRAKVYLLALIGGVIWLMLNKKMATSHTPEKGDM